MFNKKVIKKRKVKLQKEKIQEFTEWLRKHHRVSEITIYNFDKYQAHYEKVKGKSIRLYLDEVVEIIDAII